MKPYYAWKMISLTGSPYENHLFPKEFGSPDGFTAVCGRHHSALNGEFYKEPYCDECKKLQPEAEAKMLAFRQKIAAEEKPARDALAKRLTESVLQLSHKRLNRLEAWLSKEETWKWDE